ncbi:MAG: TIM44-like domain-containing protein [Myxococcota bacterium]
MPLLIAFVAFVLFRFWSASRTPTAPRVHRTTQRRPRSAPVAGPPGLRQLRARDSGFSMPVLLDYLVLLHARAHEAVGGGDWPALAPFLTDGARDKLVEAYRGVEGIDQIVVGGVKVLKVEQRGSYDFLYVQLEATQRERAGDGERRMDVREQWTLRRAAGVASVAPEKVERLGCPSCGASVEVTSMGTCKNCGTPITAGQLQWQATHVAVQARRPATVPEVGRAAGGEEASVGEPTVQQPDLAARLRELHARHPDFDDAAFGQRVDLVYHELQAAWSEGAWERARPFVTDRMFQTLRFWVDKYARAGLRNRLEDVRLSQVVVVKVELDAWYESVTVRLWGAMRDSVVDAEGRVVGGNADVAREFSEYWTFLRAAGSGGATHGDARTCPSCGAPLDRVNQAGICGYCDSKITTGRFDWVLSRIDQPEAYGG